MSQNARLDSKLAAQQRAHARAYRNGRRIQRFVHACIVATALVGVAAAVVSCTGRA